MKLYSFAFFLILVFSISGCKSTKQVSASTSPYTFDFVNAESLHDVADRAVAENKLIFIDVYADWCMPCKMMDKDVFTDKRLGKYFNEHFISYKVDAEKGIGPDLATLFEVTGLPTLLFLDATGKELVKKAGVAFQREMYELADEAIAINKGKLGE